MHTKTLIRDIDYVVRTTVTLRLMTRARFVPVYMDT